MSLYTGCHLKINKFKLYLMIIFVNQQINLENMNFTFDSNKIDNNNKKK